MIRCSTRLTGPPQAKAFLRWGAALFLSGALHAGAFAFALNWRQPGPISDTAPPAVMVDLLPAAPVMPKIEAAPGPQTPDSVERSDLQHAQPTPDGAAELVPPLPQQDAAMANPEPTPVPQTQTDRPPDEKKKPSEHRMLASRSAAPPTFEAQHRATARAREAGAASIPSAAVLHGKAS